MEKRFIYADNAATTPVTESVLREMLPFFGENFGNPSSIYKLGRNAGRALSSARERISAVFGCEPREIFFTSGGTESDNTALKCAAELMAQSGKRHIVTTAVEHPAVLNSCRMLERNGFRVTYLPVSGKGLISAEQAENAVTEDTALVSVMYANNETGTVMPVREIAEICRGKNVLFHTDAVQAAGNIPINLRETAIDMMSVSGHKLGAPKGTGFLYVRSGIALPPLINGGEQEYGLRGGTENVPAIVGLARAVEDACADIPGKQARLLPLRDMIIDGILSRVSGARLNGDRERRLAGNINLSFEGIESESLILMLDMRGICASGGSACTSRSHEPSHVLTAMGLPPALANGSLRLTIAEPFTEEDAEYIITAVAESVKQLRG